MHLPIHVWLIGGAIVALVISIYALVAIVKHRMLMHHLGLFAEDIHAVGRDTLKKEPLRCTFCRKRSHVHLWQYGEKERQMEVLLCSVCASHVAKLLELPSLLKGNPSRSTQRRERVGYRS